jgi:hypothetical protein
MLINFRSKSFWFGFSISVVLWFVANLIDKGSKPGIMCFDCDKGFGKPFRIYESSTYCCSAYIVWDGLMANILITILSGIVLGVAFHLIRNNLLGSMPKK